MTYTDKKKMHDYNVQYYQNHKKENQERCLRYRSVPAHKEIMNTRSKRRSQTINEQKFGVKVPEIVVCMYGEELIQGKVCFDHSHDCCECNSVGCPKCFRGFSCVFHNFTEGYVSKTSVKALLKMLQNTGRTLESQ